MPFRVISRMSLAGLLLPPTLTIPTLFEAMSPLCEIHRPGDLSAFTPSTLLIYTFLKQVIYGILS